MNRNNEIALVAIVPRKKDWEILREKHWYRIPVKSAPGIATQLKYLAFYQPKIFDDEKWSINYDDDNHYENQYAPSCAHSASPLNTLKPPPSSLFQKSVLNPAKHIP